MPYNAQCAAALRVLADFIFAFCFHFISPITFLTDKPRIEAACSLCRVYFITFLMKIVPVSQSLPQ